MDIAQLQEMEQFIVRAKRATYVGGGSKLLPYRLDSHDLQFQENEWAYHDSYFGERDFLGQETVYLRQTAVWGMNYYGRLLFPDQITAAEIGQMIMRSLSAMYEENRFLGDFEHRYQQLHYVDKNTGDVSAFQGKEEIYLEGKLVYTLAYHGGLITS